MECELIVDLGIYYVWYSRFFFDESNFRGYTGAFGAYAGADQAPGS